MKKRKHKVRVSVSRIKRIKHLLTKLKLRGMIKRREYKIDEWVMMSYGEYKKMDTKVVFTMSKEVALKTGFIRIVKTAGDNIEREN